MAEPRKVIILAGPNGAGKTTFAREFLAADGRCERFINADLIAAELSHVAPELVAIGAARLMLGEIDGCSSGGESFAFETTLSGTAYVRRIHDWRRAGYHVALYFLRLPSEEAAIARVAERVREGGHDIPEAVIRRRFRAGMQNFEARYRDAVDAWILLDNSGDAPLLVDWGER